MNKEFDVISKVCYIFAYDKQSVAQAWKGLRWPAVFAYDAPPQKSMAPPRIGVNHNGRTAWYVLER